MAKVLRLTPNISEGVGDLEIASGTSGPQTATKVLLFKPKISGVSAGTGIASGTYESSREIDVGVSTTRIETKALYPFSHELRPELARAFILLDEALKQVSSAMTYLKSDDAISSDDAIIHLKALLPELFCCRTLGDGFGAIIIAVYHSVANMRGMPLNLKQLKTVWNILDKIRTEPFLKHDHAVDEIMTLEDVGFEVEPPHYQYGVDLLDE